MELEKYKELTEKNMKQLEFSSALLKHLVVWSDNPGNNSQLSLVVPLDL